MGNRRTAKVAEAIREVVSSTILFELRDPRIKNVTVLGVEVPTDLRSAKVRVSIMGDEAEKRLTLKGLNAARGYVQGKVGNRLDLRFAPVLSFEIDEGVKKAAEASRILKQLAEEREAHQSADPESAAAESVAGESAASSDSDGSNSDGSKSTAELDSRQTASAPREDTD